MITNVENKRYYENKEESNMMQLDWIQSRLFGRVCYGFRRDEDGYVYIKEDEAEVVRLIYNMAINGNSLEKIQVELFNRGIKSPSGKDKWTRDVIDKTINNSKYLTYIIPFEIFAEASIEKESRCRYIRS